MTPPSPPGGCSPDQRVRTFCVCHPRATEVREASLLRLLGSKGQRLTVISFAFQGSWWPGPCSSCLSSWLGCCELSWMSGLEARVLSLEMASSHPFALLDLSPDPRWPGCPQTPDWARFGEREDFAYPCQGLCICLYPGGGLAWAFSFFSRILKANLLGASVAPGSTRSRARLCNSWEEGPCHWGEGERDELIRCASRGPFPSPPCSHC